MSRLAFGVWGLALGALTAGCGDRAATPPGSASAAAGSHVPASAPTTTARGPKIVIPGLTEPLKHASPVTSTPASPSSTAAPATPASAAPVAPPVSPPGSAAAPATAATVAPPSSAAPTAAPPQGAVATPPAPAADAAPVEINFPLLESVTKPIGEAKTLDDIPAEVRALDGREVTLTGHMLIPYASGNVREFLVAKYPWDGCCMGVPPTIYSAVEVILGKGQRLADATIPLITVRGKLSVKPQFIDGYPTGLYKIDEAKEVLP